MSQAKPRSEAQQLAYLKRVLKMNPLSDAEHVLALRNRFHRAPELSAVQASGSPGNTYELRQETAAAIAELRRSFWQTELDVIKQRLAELPLGQFPDLHHAARRLAILAANRHQFAQLAAEKQFNRGFLSNLKEILVLSQKETAELKDAVLLKMADKSRSKQVRKSLKILDKLAPELYDLEEEWFELLRTAKPSLPSRSNQAETGKAEETGWGWIIWVAIIIAAKLLGALTRG